MQMVSKTICCAVVFAMISWISWIFLLLFGLVKYSDDNIDTQTRSFCLVCLFVVANRTEVFLFLS